MRAVVARCRSFRARPHVRVGGQRLHQRQRAADPFAAAASCECDLAYTEFAGRQAITIAAKAGGGCAPRVTRAGHEISRQRWNETANISCMACCGRVLFFVCVGATPCSGGGLCRRARLTSTATSGRSFPRTASIVTARIRIIEKPAFASIGVNPPSRPDKDGIAAVVPGKAEKSALVEAGAFSK